MLKRVISRLVKEEEDKNYLYKKDYEKSYKTN